MAHDVAGVGQGDSAGWNAAAAAAGLAARWVTSGWLLRVGMTEAGRAAPVADGCLWCCGAWPSRLHTPKSKLAGRKRSAPEPRSTITILTTTTALPTRSVAMARINLPPLTRSLLAAVVVCTLLNFVLRPQTSLVEKVEQPFTSVGNGVPYLAIVPGVSVVYPWVFALATVVEQNVLGLVVTGLAVFYGGRYLERAWGSTEFSKFILFVAVIPNLLSFLLYILGYLLSKNPATL